MHKRSQKYNYTYGKITKAEDRYALVWAKKIRAIKELGGQCVNCGNKNIFVLDFHHHNKESKDSEINQLLRHQVSWTILRKEIKNCSLLCRNCHSEVHFPEPNLSGLKAKLLKISGGESCSVCGYSGKSFASLDFHHLDPSTKDFKLSTSRSIVRQLEEIEKCILVCRNCHGLLHIDRARFERLRKIIYEKVDKHRSYGVQPSLREVEEWYSCQGMSIRDIASRISCSQLLIRDFILKNKLVRGFAWKYLPAQDKTILQLRDDGLSLQKIADEIGCSKYKVLYTLKKLESNRVGDRWVNICRKD